MLIAARRARDFSAGLTEQRFRDDLVRQFAIAKAVELTGEAASRVSPTTRQAHPAIPWREIVGMRHRLVHDYQNIDLDILWMVVRDEIPPLITELERIVPPEEEI